MIGWTSVIHKKISWSDNLKPNQSFPNNLNNIDLFNLLVISIILSILAFGDICEDGCLKQIFVNNKRYQSLPNFILMINYRNKYFIKIN